MCTTMTKGHRMMIQVKSGRRRRAATDDDVGPSTAIGPAPNDDEVGPNGPAALDV